MCLAIFDDNWKPRSKMMCFKLFSLNLNNNQLYPAFHYHMISEEDKFFRARPYIPNQLIKLMYNTRYSETNNIGFYATRNKALFNMLAQIKYNWNLTNRYDILLYKYIVLPITLFNVKYSGFFDFNKKYRCYTGNQMIIHCNQKILNKYDYLSFYKDSNR